MRRWLSRVYEFGNWAADFYRMRSQGTHVSGQRALLYTVFGYLMAGHLDAPALLCINTLMIVALFMFFGAYNNYWDWQLRGERNSTQASLDQNTFILPTTILISLPWLAVVPLMILTWTLGAAPLSLVLLLGLVMLGISYITPGVRLKDRPVSFFIAPLWACLLFAQGYALLGGAMRRTSVIVFCGILFLFQCYAELLHRLDDTLHGTQPADPDATSRLMQQLRQVPLAGVCASLAATLIHPLFVNTTIWSLVRLWAVRRLPARQIVQHRTQLWRPAWSLYEFALYGLVGILHRVG